MLICGIFNLKGNSTNSSVLESCCNREKSSVKPFVAPEEAAVAKLHCG